MMMQIEVEAYKNCLGGGGHWHSLVDAWPLAANVHVRAWPLVVDESELIATL